MALAGLDGDVAPVQACNAARNPQSKAKSLALVRTVASLKLFKNAVHHVQRHSRAFVGHRDFKQSCLTFLRRNEYFSSGRILHSVVHQVG